METGCARSPERDRRLRRCPRGGYVDLAVALRVAPHRIDTIIDFDGAQRHGAKTDASPQASDPDILATMAEHVAWGRLTMPVAAIYPLEQVRAAYTELAGGYVPGKIWRVS